MTRMINQAVDIEFIAMVIAHSQIMVRRENAAVPVFSHVLPAGYDEADIAMLDWIVAEGRRAGRVFRIM